MTVGPAPPDKVVNRTTPTEDAVPIPGDVSPCSFRASSMFGGGVFLIQKRDTMPTAKKEATIEELRRRIAGSKNLFFTNYAGLTVEEITKLRTELRKDGNTYAVIKNTLFSIAAGEDVAKSLETYLAGPTGVVFAGEDPVGPAKAIKTFSDSVKPLEVKAAYIDGQVVDAKQVAALAALPPKIELLAKLVGSLKSPLYGLVTVLSGNQSGLVRVLNAIREQKSAGGDGPTPTPEPTS
jgi:large subunit ribosomal protein L10